MILFTVSFSIRSLKRSNILKMKPQIFPRQPQHLGVLRQYILTISTCLPLAAAGSTVAWPSSALPRIMAKEAPVFLDFTEISWMVSSFYLGNMTSPIPAEYLANKLGRKTTLLYSGLLPIISWLLIFYGTDPLFLFASRYLAGLQYGLVSTIQPIYVGETVQSDCKNALKPLNNFMFGAGNLFGFVVGSFVSYTTLVLMMILIPLLFLFSFFYMPETPYYSLMKDKHRDARESLMWLRGDLNGIELETEFNEIERYVQTQMMRSSFYNDILLPKSSKQSIIIGIVFSAYKSLSGTHAVLAFATLTLPKSKLVASLDQHDCLIILGMTSVASSLLAPIISDKYLHKNLLLVYISLCCVSLFSISICLILKSKMNLSNISSNIIFLILILFQNVSHYFTCNQIDVIFKDELFPVNLRIKSHVLETIAFASLSFLTNKLYLNMANWDGIYLNYIVYFISCLAIIIFVVICVPETKGKTIQEIQDTLSGIERCRITTPVLSRTF